MVEVKRRFKAKVSKDKGLTWKKARGTGWTITDITSVKDNPFGYVFIVDMGDMMVDIEVPERMLKIILKDVEERKLFDDNGGEENGTD